MITQLTSIWHEILKEEFDKPYFKELSLFLDKEYNEKVIYPAKDLIFNAFNLTPFENIKVVILGQDPYHEPNQAQGLAFYVPENVKSPPSLKNIAKELATEYKRDEIKIPNLLSWSKQGVLLLNTTLTVEEHKAFSHSGRGWETFTNAVIHHIAEKREHIVFILWGSPAQKKGAFIDRAKHLVIESAHPSPLSAYRGFFGSTPFTRANDYLKSTNQKEIDWLP